jgi:choline dehydrogenase-like flavoprotein
MKFRCLQPVTLYPHTRPLASIAAGIQWLATRQGICGSNHFDCVACVKSSPDLEYPDLQFTLSPIAMDDLSFDPMQEHAFQMHVGLMRTYSRGRVELRSSDPSTPPRILVNYLQDDRDRAAMRAGIRMLRKLVEQPAFGHLAGEEIFPGDHVLTDDALDEALKTHVASQWHLTSTAAMGPSTDPGAVVDASGKVHGLERLRVVDASVMPMATNGNTNCPTSACACGSNRAAPRRTVPRRAAPCRAAPHRAAPCRTVPHRAATCHTVPHRTASEPFSRHPSRVRARRAVMLAEKLSDAILGKPALAPIWAEGCGEAEVSAYTPELEPVPVPRSPTRRAM